eukprot:TRINITY_DN61146_c0_g1_i1.p2 TRINITY_DN61146_c0_g1~~TRINITY_DN61146_c0_g1_i1.p2  ORF type:complete len:134 (+),score=15.91 TRINITY_DN61146_c0_g1_i1:50-403(+)
MDVQAHHPSRLVPRLVDVAQLHCHAEQDQPTYATSESNPRLSETLRVYEVTVLPSDTRGAQAGPQEWMYELSGKGDPWAAHNLAAEEYLTGVPSVWVGTRPTTLGPVASREPLQILL